MAGTQQPPPREPSQAPVQSQSPAPPAGPAPLTGASLALGTIALSLATFMNVLDSSIANVSIPAISGDIGVSPDQGTWVITSFGVANAISLPLTGWLTQRFGQVRLFTSAIFLFVLASFMCALAPTLGTLIGFRVLQGAVAGPMIPLSQALLLSSFPRAKAGAALGIWAMTTLVAPVLGPLLGGWITDNFSWPWIFYINVPVGLIAGGITWTLYRKRETPTRKLPIDTIGLGLLVLWVGALQIMLDKGKDLDWFGSTQIVALAIVAFVGLVLWLIWELTEEHPVVDLSLFRRRNFTVSTIALLIAYGMFFANIVLVPLWLQQYMGYTATAASYVVAPIGLLALILTPLVARAGPRIDPRVFVTFAFAMFGIVSLMRSQFSTEASLGVLMAPTILQGAAMATFFVPLTALGLSGLPPSRIPSASGVMNFARILAGSFGTSIVTTMWDRRATLHHSQLVERLANGSPATDAALAGLQAGGLDMQQSYGYVDRLINRQAFMLSANDMFLATGVMFMLLIGVVWLARPIKDPAATAAAGGGAH
jgi:DHA2 family multidrug resistance protein